MGSVRDCRFVVVVAVISLPAILCNVQPPALNLASLNQGGDLGACQSCKLFIDSFMRGLERTARGKYEGGDAAWEEEKHKKSYKRSEVRLIDIQEGICKEETKYSVQCHHMAEKAEEFIEEWWAQNPDASDDLYTYICVDKMQVCCPRHHYGKNCTPCPGDHKNICSGNGKCRGDGTRKGNGTCMCDQGFRGDNCEHCMPNYYKTPLVGNKFVCFPCHKSCNGCRESTAKDCIVCKNGFVFDSDEGCIDINECDDIDRCKKDEFCMNSLGSYACMKCHKACKTCHGDGPDMCRKCAEGFSRKGEFCISDRDDDIDQNEKFAMSRYMTYLGLILATIILYPKSTSLAGLVGALALSYMMGAEYYCMINGYTGLINLKDYDIMQLLRT